MRVYAYMCMRECVCALDKRRRKEVGKIVVEAKGKKRRKKREEKEEARR